MMASTVFQTWPCQTWPCQLPGANVVASPKIPSLPAHWYAATSVKPTAPSKTSAETTGRPSPARRLCPKPPQDHPHIYLNMGDASEILCPYCSTLFCFDPSLGAHEADPADCAYGDID